MLINVTANVLPTAIAVCPVTPLRKQRTTETVVPAI